MDKALASTAATSGEPPGPWRSFWAAFCVNRGAVLGLALLAMAVLAAVFAPVLAPHDPTSQAGPHLLPPAWMAGGDAAWPLGTDAVGRGVLSRLLFGARLSLAVGLATVVLAMAVGVPLGLLAGYCGGVVDTVIARAMDILLAFPSLLLALVLVAAAGPGLLNATLAIALTMQPYFVRLVRASAMAEKQRPYVAAARMAGAGHLRLMLRTVLPNCTAPLIVQASLSFSSAILDVAALGFLGLGAQPPAPEWGTMLAESREFFLSAWWIVAFPGACILLTVLAVNLVGDGLRDALDPKLRRS